MTATQTQHTPRTDEPGTQIGTAGRRALATCRLLLSFVFVWPVLDKTFGLGYSTPPEASWLAGTSPTTGYLTFIDNPVSGTFGAMAGPVTDVLFMLGMLGTGLALLLGIGLRVAAVAGGLLMILLWLTAWPFAVGSHNPVVDSHLVYAALLVALAATRSGDTWGLGRVWARSGLPGTTTWLR